MKRRLDQELVRRKLVATRSQAESYIKLGYVTVGRGQEMEIVSKPGFFVTEEAQITVTVREQYVSRAGLKLASVAETLKLDFRDKVVLDVGSSTGGFTDYALKHGAHKVYAVDVGTNQLHPSIRSDPRVESHEQTDIREYSEKSQKLCGRTENVTFDLVLIDVSFISLREVLPAVARLAGSGTRVVAMAKPQFETQAGSRSIGGRDDRKHKGVIKNDSMRREVLKHFETWVQKLFIVIDKADSEVAGAKGNRERFYLLKKSS